MLNWTWTCFTLKPFSLSFTLVYLRAHGSTRRPSIMAYPSLRDAFLLLRRASWTFGQSLARASLSCLEKSSLNWMPSSLRTLASFDFFHTSSLAHRVVNWMIIGLGNLLWAASFILPRRWTVSTVSLSLFTATGMILVRILTTASFVSLSFSGKPIILRFHLLLYLALSKHVFQNNVFFF